MANKNFVVQNGITVGEVTIFAGNSDIRTTGNITVTGTGTINVPSIGVSSIAINDSSIAINDTGPSGSTIELTLDNAIAANVSASGMNLPTGSAYRINNTDVLSYNTLKSGVVNSSLTSVGTLLNLTVSGNTAIDNTVYGRGIYDFSNRVVSSSNGTGNLTITGAGISLTATGPGATTVGSSTSVPVITTDAYGRVVALTSSAISTSFSVSGTSGTASVSGGSTLSFASTNGVTIAVGSTYANISTPQDLRTTASPSFSSVTVTSTAESTSAITGALQVAGGVGIGANIYVAGTSTLKGNVNIGGNLVVSGLSVSIGTSDLSIQDPIINLHTFANLQPLTSNDSSDIGLKFHYYDNADSHAFIGRASDTGYLEWYAKGDDEGNVFVGTHYGTIKGGAIWLANTTISTSTTTGALRVDGGAGIAGNLYIGGGAGTAIVHTGHILPSANLSYNLGSPTAWYSTFYGVSTQARYADLAENYQADAIYEPGTVLMFGGENEVTLADADTTAVAGVVSTNPAHLMNGALQGARVVPIALQGRVPCKVIGPVAKGDMLVSAGFGFAKTAPDRQLGMRFGQAIGKSLENVEPGVKATIEVVVGRV